MADTIKHFLDKTGTELLYRQVLKNCRNVVHTASEFTENNPILSKGVVGFETDTKHFKIGDGSTAWNLLEYYNTTTIKAEDVFFDNDTSKTLDKQFTDLKVKKAFTFSDNNEVNKYIDEIYIANPPSDFTQTRVSFYFAYFSSSQNKYYNQVRVGNESDMSKFVNIIFGYYDTLQEAIDALRTYKGIFKVGQNYIKCDFSDLVISESYKKGYNCSYYDTTILHNSPAIENYIINEKIDSLDSKLIIPITNIADRNSVSGVTAKGQIYYNLTQNQLLQVTNNALNSFSVVPFDSNALYLWENTLSKYNGVKLVPLDSGWLFSDCAKVNKYIKEVYLESVPVNYKPNRRIQIRIGIQSSSTNKYFNSIRLGESTDTTYFVDLVSEHYDTIQDAIDAICDKPKIYYINGKGAALIDLTSINKACDLIFPNITYYDVTNIDLSPIIKNYYENLYDNEVVVSQENANAINGNLSHQCKDQFENLDTVGVFRDGLLLARDKYELNKLGKVTYKDGLDGVTAFMYNKRSVKYPSYYNNLSTYTPYSPTTEGSVNSMTSFVDDPSGSSNKVLMISCDQIISGAKKIRNQFPFNRYPVTEFSDSVKMWLPSDMRTALLSYRDEIKWFGIGGAWGTFGSPVGQTSKMYSGCGNSFDIVKPDADSNELYYNLRCRRRHCNTSHGLENYDVLTEEMSSFPVKADEWITIKRYWKAGNPGICNYEITDSDGTHIWNMDAYNALPDPENEITRYGSKYLGSNPYNIFSPFICKIYTSSELAQHCIDTIGRCYLYFKDYEFISGKNINAIEKE